MTEADQPIGVDSLAASAGAQLRAAREKRGLHIAALAAAMKVPQRKLEALEADRYDALPDLTFTRALAQSVCRALKIDAQPVLDRLPSVGDMPRLGRVGAGLNAPFRERPGRDEPNDRTWLRKPLFWITLAVLSAAAALALMPDRWLALGFDAARAPASNVMVSVPVAARPLAASAPAALALPAAQTTAISEAVVVAPAAPAAASAVGTAPLAATNGTLLKLQALSESWVEVQDGNGQTLLQRHLQAGEAVGLDGALPLRLTVGNAAATRVQFRGQPVDLSTNTRDNVARMQLN